MVVLEYLRQGLASGDAILKSWTRQLLRLSYFVVGNLMISRSRQAHLQQKVRKLCRSDPQESGGVVLQSLLAIDRDLTVIHHAGQLSNTASWKAWKSDSP